MDFITGIAWCMAQEEELDDDEDDKEEDMDTEDSESENEYEEEVVPIGQRLKEWFTRDEPIAQKAVEWLQEAGRRFAYFMSAELKRCVFL